MESEINYLSHVSPRIRVLSIVEDKHMQIGCAPAGCALFGPFAAKVERKARTIYPGGMKPFRQPIGSSTALKSCVTYIAFRPKCHPSTPKGS